MWFSTKQEDTHALARDLSRIQHSAAALEECKSQYYQEVSVQHLTGNSKVFPDTVAKVITSCAALCVFD
jgi:hypothetical protein